MEKLYILAASLVKSEPGRTATSLMQGWRLSSSEDAAKGAFLSTVMAEKPDFCIAQLLTMEIPESVLRAALEASNE